MHEIHLLIYLAKEILFRRQEYFWRITTTTKTGPSRSQSCGTTRPSSPPSWLCSLSCGPLGWHWVPWYSWWSWAWGSGQKEIQGDAWGDTARCTKTSRWLQNTSSALALPKWNFCFEVNGRFGTTWRVTLCFCGALQGWSSVHPMLCQPNNFACTDPKQQSPTFFVGLDFCNLRTANHLSPRSTYNH